MEFKDWVKYCIGIVTQLEKDGGELNNKLKGELAEVVLEVHLDKVKQNLEAFGYNCIIVKNLALVHRSTNDKLYSTEIDIALITEYRVYLFECKSYSGKKRITNECTLRSVNTVDVFKQSTYHVDMFEKTFKEHRYRYQDRKGMQSPMKMIFFEFSSSLADDQRSEEFIEIVPYLNVTNFFEWFADELDEYSTRKVQWNLEGLLEAMEVLDDNRELIMKYHLKRLGTSKSKKKSSKSKTRRKK